MDFITLLVSKGKTGEITGAATVNSTACDVTVCVHVHTANTHTHTHTKFCLILFEFFSLLGSERKL